MACRDNGLDITHYDQQMQLCIKEMEEKENLEKEKAHGNN